jgi:hypothetical protein
VGHSPSQNLPPLWSSLLAKVCNYMKIRVTCELLVCNCRANFTRIVAVLVMVRFGTTCVKNLERTTLFRQGLSFKKHVNLLHVSRSGCAAVPPFFLRLFLRPNGLSLPDQNVPGSCEATRAAVHRAQLLSGISRITTRPHNLDNVEGGCSSESEELRAPFIMVEDTCVQDRTQGTMQG